MSVKNLGFNELYGIGDVDSFLSKTKEKCEQKLRGKKFAGMDKDDVIQEVLIKVHKSLDKYDSEKAKMSTYVDHVIENMIKDCYKKCGAEKNLMIINALEIEDSYSWEGEESSSGVHVGVTDIGYLKVELSMDININLNLNAREQEIYDLRTRGYEFIEIAEIIGVSKARISQIWKGVKEKFVHI